MWEGGVLTLPFLPKRRALFPLLRFIHSYIRTYSCPVDRRMRIGQPGKASPLASEALSLSIFKGGQGKDGKRPEPAKPTGPEPGKQKPEREGDKGKRKGKNPRTERLVPFIGRNRYPCLNLPANRPGLPGSGQWPDVPHPEPFRGWQARVSGAFQRVPCLPSRGRVAPGY